VLEGQNGSKWVDTSSPRTGKQTIPDETGSVSGKKNSIPAYHPTFFASQTSLKITRKSSLTGRLPVNMQHWRPLVPLSTVNMSAPPSSTPESPPCATPSPPVSVPPHSALPSLSLPALAETRPSKLSKENCFATCLANPGPATSTNTSCIDQATHGFIDPSRIRGTIGPTTRDTSMVCDGP